MSVNPVAANAVAANAVAANQPMFNERGLMDARLLPEADI